jgi:transposase
MLWLHLRRFACRACPHRPWETSTTFGEQVKWTERLYHQVREEFLRGCPSRELARRYGLSERTVFRWTFERSRGGRPRKLGRAIGIDEYARRKGHRYNTLIVDVEKGQPIATFKGRRAEDVIAWFNSRPQDERDQVEVVVLDMSKTYYAAIQEVFGDRVHVIDRFHVVKQAVDALDEVLRSVQKQLDNDDAKAPPLSTSELLDEQPERRRLTVVFVCDPLREFFGTTAYSLGVAVALPMLKGVGPDPYRRCCRCMVFFSPRCR